MAYYRGDYYRGDYYRGDPFLGALGGIVAGTVGKLAGKAASWVGKQVGGSSVKKAAAVSLGAAAMPILQSAAPSFIPTINIGNTKIDPLAALPGGRPLISSSSCPPGYHLDKRTKSKCVRNRSMNPLNPRALRRGLRRAEKFEKFARRTVNALRTGPKKFKTRTRSS